MIGILAALGLTFAVLMLVAGKLRSLPAQAELDELDAELEAPDYETESEFAAEPDLEAEAERDAAPVAAALDMPRETSPAVDAAPSAKPAVRSEAAAEERAGPEKATTGLNLGQPTLQTSSVPVEPATPAFERAEGAEAASDDSAPKAAQTDFTAQPTKIIAEPPEVEQPEPEPVDFSNQPTTIFTEPSTEAPIVERATSAGELSADGGAPQEEAVDFAAQATVIVDSSVVDAALNTPAPAADGASEFTNQATVVVSSLSEVSGAASAIASNEVTSSEPKPSDDGSSVAASPDGGASSDDTAIGLGGKETVIVDSSGEVLRAAKKSAVVVAASESKAAAADPDEEMATIELRPEEGGRSPDAPSPTTVLREVASILMAPDSGESTAHDLADGVDTIIGRSPRVDIVVSDDDSVSGHHLRIRVTGRVYTVFDLGSSNGSFLNDRRLVKEMPLDPGDKIRIGQTRMIFQILRR